MLKGDVASVSKERLSDASQLYTRAAALALCGGLAALCLADPTREGIAAGNGAAGAALVTLLALMPLGFWRILQTFADGPQPAAAGGGSAVKPALEDAVSALVSHFEGLAASRPHMRLDAATCRRFLSARKGDVAAAQDMLAKCAEWREQTRPGEITEDRVKTELAKQKCCVQGFDQTGRPIVWVFVSRHDKADRDIEELTRLLLLTMEASIKKAEERGHEQVCVVFDLAGFGVKCMDFEFVRRLINLLANYYPERLGQVLLWNAPSLFNWFWRIVHPWIDPRTAEKIDFLGGAELGLRVDEAMMPSGVAARVMKQA